MFAYCLNNPVQHEDQQGTFVNTVTGAIVGGIIGAINAYIEGEDVTAGALIGATTGALAGAAADFAIATGGIGAVAIAAVGGAAASSISYLGNKVANNGEIRGDELLLEATVGAAANLLTFGVGDGKLIKAGGKAISNMANNFTTTMMKNTTKTVAGKTVYKSVKTVVKHVAKNFMTATAETAAISGGAWLNSKAWGVLIQ